MFTGVAWVRTHCDDFRLWGLEGLSLKKRRRPKRPESNMRERGKRFRQPLPFERFKKFGVLRYVNLKHVDTSRVSSRFYVQPKEGFETQWAFLDSVLCQARLQTLVNNFAKKARTCQQERAPCWRFTTISNDFQVSWKTSLFFLCFLAQLLFPSFASLKVFVCRGCPRLSMCVPLTWLPLQTKNCEKTSIITCRVFSGKK